MNNLFYDKYLSTIENTLEKHLSTTACNNDKVLEAMRYSVLGGGKRIRAILVLNFCRALGGTLTDAHTLAAAVEMVHAYSLIHDDLPCMDNDDMRRGKPSCHKAFGEATALLAGDGLLTLAFSAIANDGNLSSSQLIKAVKELAEAAGCNGMIGGQLMDIEGNCKTVEDLSRMSLLKTGALIRCAVKLGCIAANADEKTTEIAELYAEYLGLSFQITDDILDITGNEAELGKTIGSDVKQHKTTFASLEGLGGAQQMADTLTKRAMACLTEIGISEDDFLFTLTQQLSNRQK